MAPGSKFLEKLIVPYPVKEFPTFYGSRRLNNSSQQTHK